MYKSLLSVILLVFVSSVTASEVNPGKVTKVLTGPAYGSKVLISVEPKPTGLPECATNAWYDYAFDTTTEEGKAVLSLVLTAYTANKNIWIGGLNQCQQFNGVEDLKHILLK